MVAKKLKSRKGKRLPAAAVAADATADAIAPMTVASPGMDNDSVHSSSFDEVSSHDDYDELDSPISQQSRENGILEGLSQNLERIGKFADSYFLGGGGGEDDGGEPNKSMLSSEGEEDTLLFSEDSNESSDGDEERDDNKRRSGRRNGRENSKERRDPAVAVPPKPGSKVPVTAAKVPPPTHISVASSSHHTMADTMIYMKDPMSLTSPNDQTAMQLSTFTHSDTVISGATSMLASMYDDEDYSDCSDEEESTLQQTPMAVDLTSMHAVASANIRPTMVAATWDAASAAHPPVVPLQKAVSAKLPSAATQPKKIMFRKHGLSRLSSPFGHKPSSAVKHHAQGAARQLGSIKAKTSHVSHDVRATMIPEQLPMPSHGLAVAAKGNNWSLQEGRAWRPQQQQHHRHRYNSNFRRVQPRSVQSATVYHPGNDLVEHPPPASSTFGGGGPIILPTPAGGRGAAMHQGEPPLSPPTTSTVANSEVALATAVSTMPPVSRDAATVMVHAQPAHVEMRRPRSLPIASSPPNVVARKNIQKRVENIVKGKGSPIGFGDDERVASSHKKMRTRKSREPHEQRKPKPTTTVHVAAPETMRQDQPAIKSKDPFPSEQQQQQDSEKEVSAGAFGQAVQSPSRIPGVRRRVNDIMKTTSRSSQHAFTKAKRSWPGKYNDDDDDSDNSSYNSESRSPQKNTQLVQAPYSPAYAVPRCGLISTTAALTSPQKPHASVRHQHLTTSQSAVAMAASTEARPDNGTMTPAAAAAVPASATERTTSNKVPDTIGMQPVFSDSNSLLAVSSAMPVAFAPQSSSTPAGSKLVRTTKVLANETTADTDVGPQAKHALDSETCEEEFVLDLLSKASEEEIVFDENHNQRFALWNNHFLWEFPMSRTKSTRDRVQLDEASQESLHLEEIENQQELPTPAPIAKNPSVKTPHAASFASLHAQTPKSLAEDGKSRVLDSHEEAKEFPLLSTRASRQADTGKSSKNVQSPTHSIKSAGTALIQSDPALMSCPPTPIAGTCTAAASKIEARFAEKETSMLPASSRKPEEKVALPREEVKPSLGATAASKRPRTREQAKRLKQLFQDSRKKQEVAIHAEPGSGSLVEGHVEVERKAPTSKKWFRQRKVSKDGGATPRSALSCTPCDDDKSLVGAATPQEAFKTSIGGDKNGTFCPPEQPIETESILQRANGQEQNPALSPQPRDARNSNAGKADDGAAVKTVQSGDETVGIEIENILREYSPSKASPIYPDYMILDPLVSQFGFGPKPSPANSQSKDATKADPPAFQQHDVNPGKMTDIQILESLLKEEDDIELQRNSPRPTPCALSPPREASALRITSQAISAHSGIEVERGGPSRQNSQQFVSQCQTPASDSVYSLYDDEGNKLTQRPAPMQLVRKPTTLAELQYLNDAANRSSIQTPHTVRSDPGLPPRPPSRTPGSVKSLKVSVAAKERGRLFPSRTFRRMPSPFGILKNKSKSPQKSPKNPEKSPVKAKSPRSPRAILKRIGRSLSPRQLRSPKQETVFDFDRIASPEKDDFDMIRENISAKTDPTPEAATGAVASLSHTSEGASAVRELTPRREASGVEDQAEPIQIQERQASRVLTAYELPQEAKTSEATVLYPFLDFNPCHADLYSPNSRQLCTCTGDFDESKLRADISPTSDEALFESVMESSCHSEFAAMPNALDDLHDDLHEESSIVETAPVTVPKQDDDELEVIESDFIRVQPLLRQSGSNSPLMELLSVDSTVTAMERARQTLSPAAASEVVAADVNESVATATSKNSKSLKKRLTKKLGKLTKNTFSRQRTATAMSQHESREGDEDEDRLDNDSQRDVEEPQPVPTPMTRNKVSFRDEKEYRDDAKPERTIPEQLPNNRSSSIRQGKFSKFSGMGSTEPSEASLYESVGSISRPTKSSCRSAESDFSPLVEADDGNRRSVDRGATRRRTRKLSSQNLTSPASRLEYVERKLARRLATDLKVLAAIEKRRRKLQHNKSLDNTEERTSAMLKAVEDIVQQRIARYEKEAAAEAAAAKRAAEEEERQRSWFNRVADEFTRMFSCSGDR